MSPSVYSTLSPRKLARSAGMAFAAVAALSISTLPCHADPVITSVSPIYAEQTQTITIDGSDFGDSAAFLSDTTGFANCSSFPCAGTSTAIEFNDVTGGWGAGYGNDGVGLVVDSWSDSQIVLGGFGGSYIAYGPTTFELITGDQVQIDVWNSDVGSGYNDNSNDPLVPDPSYPVATFDTTVSPEVVTPEPSSILLMATGLLALAFVVLRKRSGVGLITRV